MKFGIIVFPGSNCDADCHHVVTKVMGQSARYIWHKETDIAGLDAIILPGGFSYGDYLRCGAIAKFSPVMSEVVRFAGRGGLVFGICNGFQILTEIGLLPGALMRNSGLKFICEIVSLNLINNQTPFTRSGNTQKEFRIPIAHMEGNYFIDPDELKRIEDNSQIVFKYAGENPNGSIKKIAGVCNKKGNVMGMMPHPERVSESLLGGEDGKFIWESLISSKD